MTAHVHVEHILRALRRHPLIVLILIIEVAFAFSVVCNMTLMASHRILAWRQQSGLREPGLGVLSSTDRSRATGDNHWARTLESMRAIEAVPGVEGVAAVFSLPLNQNSSIVSFSRSRPAGTGDEGLPVNVFIGSPNMLDVLGLEVSKGRAFIRDEYVLEKKPAEALNQASAVLMSEQLAKKLFGSSDALGETVYVEHHPMRVVGVLRHLLSPVPTLNTENELTAVVPVLPHRDTTEFVIRATPVDLDQVLQRSARAMLTSNPHGVIESVKRYEDLRREYFQHDRAMLRLMSYALLALLIVTVIGIGGWRVSGCRDEENRLAFGAHWAPCEATSCFTFSSKTCSW